jgi:hypothetical protein
MSVRDNHQMTIVIGIEVEYHVAVFSFENNKAVIIINILFSSIAEYAFTVFGMFESLNIF